MRSKDPVRRPPGFTLIELLIVMAIIGIVLAFILSAAMGGIRQAEERATQSLIIKLDAGMADRVDAILSTRPEYNNAHFNMATVLITANGSPLALTSNQRAQIIARFDQVKAELPDVFVVQATDSFYPINFAAVPFPGTADSTVFSNWAKASATGTAYGNYLLPLGSGVLNDNSTTFGASGASTTGIFGASYSAAAGLYKNLVAQVLLNNPGLTPPKPINLGYDGVDNDGNGLVDEITENDIGQTKGTISKPMIALLGHHTHKTARAEMLYALLVEGQGPFGSVLSRDDFNDKEVRDTDGDGLPEFVDAWGEPIQFYRWPVGFGDDLQRHGYVSPTGATPTPGLPSNNTVYQGASDNREQNPLDPNQQLLSPSWWASANNANPVGTAAAPLSGPAALFQSMFIPLTDPNFLTAAAPKVGPLWDRGGGSARRAYFSKFLILSGGPDKAPGVPVLDPNYYSNVLQYMTTSMGAVPTVGTGGTGSYTVYNLLCEGQAAQITPNRVDAIYMGQSTAAADLNLSYAIQEAGNDDITSHSVQSSGGAIH